MHRVSISPAMSVITLNLNGVNTIMKTEIVRLDEKHDPNICCLEETQFKYDT